MESGAQVSAPSSISTLPLFYVGVPLTIQFSRTRLYTWAKKDTIRLKCLAKTEKHNTIALVKARTRFARSWVQRVLLTIRLLHPPLTCKRLNKLSCFVCGEPSIIDNNLSMQLWHHYINWVQQLFVLILRSQWKALSILESYFALDRKIVSI